MDPNPEVNPRQRRVNRVVHHHGNGRRRDVAQRLAQRLGRRLELAVVDDVEVAGPIQGRLRSLGSRGRREDEILAGAPVDLQMTIDLHRWKDDRDRCGSEQHVAVELEAAVLGDFPHIPDPGLVVIDVGRADPQETVVVVGGGHALQRLCSNVFGDQLLER